MYLSWNTETIPDGASIPDYYNRGFVFTRRGKNSMDQTRSSRIRLKDFELTSENRRILRKNEHLTLSVHPIPYPNYEWSIHKLGKDFYYEKFGADVFSANKIKELMTDSEQSSFTTVLAYTEQEATQPSGYAICFEDDTLLHYSYPFYDHKHLPKDTGLGMMLKAIEYAKDNGKEFIYLGSLSRPSDTYKAQFKGFEWFDGKNWQTETDTLKTVLHE